MKNFAGNRRGITGKVERFIWKVREAGRNVGLENAPRSSKHASDDYNEAYARKLLLTATYDRVFYGGGGVK